MIDKIPIEYAGQWVMFRGWTCREIVAHGTDLGKMFQEAKRKGATEPVLLFVPDPNITYIYRAA